eukprot:6492622-Amphidinium_carterae.1
MHLTPIFNTHRRLRQSEVIALRAQAWRLYLHRVQCCWDARRLRRIKPRQHIRHHIGDARDVMRFQGPPRQGAPV